MKETYSQNNYGGSSCNKETKITGGSCCQLGGKKIKSIGTRAEVFHDSAKRTSGGLKKSDLFKDKHGRIRSKKASEASKKKLLVEGNKFKQFVDQAKMRSGKPFKLVTKK